MKQNETRKQIHQNQRTQWSVMLWPNHFNELDKLHLIIEYKILVRQIHLLGVCVRVFAWFLPSRHKMTFDTTIHVYLFLKNIFIINRSLAFLLVLFLFVCVSRISNTWTLLCVYVQFFFLFIHELASSWSIIINRLNRLWCSTILFFHQIKVDDAMHWRVVHTQHQ